MLVQEQNKLNLIRKDGQTLVKVIHMKHAGVAEVNITGVCVFFVFFCGFKVKTAIEFFLISLLVNVISLKRE